MKRADSKQIAAAFGEAVRGKRLVLNLSQEKLAERCGLHRTYLADVERGKRNPSLQSIVAISSGLNISTSDLFAAMQTHLSQDTRKASSRNKSNK